MNDLVRFGLILMLVALISAGSLSYVNRITLPKILAQQTQELNQGLNSVLPGAQDGIIIPVPVAGTVSYYEGYRDKDKTKLEGYAFLVESDGYSSTIRTLVGMDSDFNILAIQVLSQQETPGLGTRVQEIRSGETTPWWQDQFQNQSAANLAVDKDGGAIQSITGATITSRAIADGIANKARELSELIQTK